MSVYVFVWTTRFLMLVFHCSICSSYKILSLPSIYKILGHKIHNMCIHVHVPGYACISVSPSIPESGWATRFDLRLIE